MHIWIYISKRYKDMLRYENDLMSSFDSVKLFTNIPQYRIFATSILKCIGFLCFTEHEDIDRATVTSDTV